MSHTQLTTASDEEMPGAAASKPLTSRWRGWGLAVTSVGLVCMVGATWPRKQVTHLQRFGQMRVAMMKTFEESLATSSNLETKIEFVLGEEGAEEPSAMEINVKLGQDADFAVPDRRLEGLQQAAEITFNANEGNGADLKAAFDKIKAELSKGVDDDTKAFMDGVDITQSGDSVIASVSLTPLMQNVPSAELDETFEKKPEMSANFKFGRDLDTIFDNTKDNVVVAWGGLHFTLSAKFKVLAIDMLKKATPFSGIPPTLMEGLALVAGKLELRYKTADELKDMFAGVPTVEELVPELKAYFEEAPPTFMTVLKEDIMTNVNGLHKVELRGLPQKEKIEIDFTNFKPIKLLGKMLDILDSSGEPTGEPVVVDED